MTLKKNIISVLFVCFLAGTINGQVTIGINQPAKPGALLDLKQEDISGSNSTKGLMLPRVLLTDEENLLPMFDAGYNKAEEDANHTGLLVYNVNTCFMNGPGLYAWNGKEWVIIHEKRHPEVYTYEDQEGKPFLARKFGDAGIWMTENLAVESYAVPRDNPSESVYTSIVVKHPNNKPELTANNRWMGVFYDFTTATNNTPLNNLKNKDARIQGICPSGWHLPSTQEWWNLEEEIVKNTDKYTTLDYSYLSKGINPSTTNLTSGNFEYGKHYREGLIDPCPTPETETASVPGISLRNSLGGFAVRMVGVFYGTPDNYGTKAGFWVAYSNGSAGRNRVFTKSSSNSDLVIHNNWGGGTGANSRLYSVRCVKNEE